MSALQKSIMKSKLPPRCPRSFKQKLAPFGMSRCKNYQPESWKRFFHRTEDVETEGGTFRVYLTSEPDHPLRPRIVTLHGGGYSGLSWALFAEEVTYMVHCQVISIDIRGHGETQAKDPDDMSAETLVKDVEQVLQKLFGDEMPPLILVGHSMGGAIAVRAAHLPSLQHYVQGLVVIDVVEGTAMEALASMQSFLRGRPTHFKSIRHAIEWCVRSGQVRNVSSARVSMPSQIVNVETGLLSTRELEDMSLDDSEADGVPLARADSIAEEDEPPESPDDLEPEPEPARVKHDEPVFVKPSEDLKRYKWRIDLSGTERHWAGWFRGLSALFLSAPAPRLLLLASIDGLDRELTVGQMQGKFQMQVLTRCGHAVHEDTPEEVARVVAAFALRHRLTSATESGENMNLVAAPGC
ncbi:protein phosphatase methylesterase 1 isoform X2 [Ostrinia furnacalis]|uniref:protein phosphatase methylesterase 1 isoform X2 n=1 Tax=Ostrinia furnacalis TaxID=93504 RepID=UPI0010396DD3|nr:protein phosphatase methylesterase 1 isoform X2 [Ostrinia furnacalis]